MTTLLIGQQIKFNGTDGTIVAAKGERYTAILTDGTVIENLPAESFALAESTLHDQLESALALLASTRATAATALRKHDEELALWREQNAGMITAVAESKALADTVDQAARALVLRIATETGDRKPNAHAHVAERSGVQIKANDSDLVKWLITANRPDALKPNTAQVNTLIKAGGIVPEEIGVMVKTLVVNIDTDLSDLLRTVEPLPMERQFAAPVIASAPESGESA